LFLLQHDTRRLLLLARLLLKEALTPQALGRVALALLGAVIVLWPEGDGLPLPRTLPEWLGVLGGFTTFSAFSLETISMWERGEAAGAAAYVAASVVLSLIGLVAGMALVRSLG
jgi:fluoride ion exporter CrcB/FEX